MGRALRPAARGEGRVEPNPMVGAVIVRGAQIISEGWHRRFGGPHAEVEALRAAGRRARGSTVYVTLEPCCHWGKTPPCTDALIAAGVRRVVVAVRDPFPPVAGRGIRRLRAAGMRVDVGILEKEARQLNAPFFQRVTTRKPWVILKWAQSLDGKIATRAGESKWITSLESRRRAHTLRGRVDAVVVGIGTVMTDDPELTCRLVRPRRVATRVVLDTHLRIPLRSKLVRTARRTPVLVFCGRSAPATRQRRLAEAGVEVCTIPSRRAGLSLVALLDELGRRSMTNVMIEGGGKLLGSFFDAGLANEVVAFVAPKLIGGAAAPGPLGGEGIAAIKTASHGKVIERRMCGGDWMWRIRLRGVHG